MAFYFSISFHFLSYASFTAISEWAKMSVSELTLFSDFWFFILFNSKQKFSHRH